MDLNFLLSLSLRMISICCFFSNGKQMEFFFSNFDWLMHEPPNQVKNCSDFYFVVFFNHQIRIWMWFIIKNREDCHENGVTVAHLYERKNCLSKLFFSDCYFQKKWSGFDFFPPQLDSDCRRLDNHVLN